MVCVHGRLRSIDAVNPCNFQFCISSIDLHRIIAQFELGVHALATRLRQLLIGLLLLTTARRHYRRYLGARFPELAGHPLNYVLQLLASQLMLHLCRFVQVQNIGRRG